MDTLVREVMSPNPVTCSHDETICNVIEKLQRFRIDSLPIVDKECRVLGIVTKSQIVGMLQRGAGWDDTIEKSYNKNVICLRGDINVYEICSMPVKRLPVLDDEDKLVGIITKTDLIKIFSRDVRQIKERLSTIIESTHNGIMAIDENRTIMTFNPAAEKIMGLKAEDVLGKTVELFFPDSCLLDVLSDRRSKSGLNVMARGKSLLVNVAPIIRNEEMLGAVAFFQDISELESISFQLNSFKKLNTKLRAIIESSFDGICVVKQDGEIEEVNQAFEHLMGTKTLDDNLLDKLISQVKESAAAVTAVQKTVAGKQVVITGNPVFNGNNELSMIVTNVRDITLLNNLKNELEATKELKERYSRELKNLRHQQFAPDQIVANSPLMKNVVELAQRVATFDSTVLLLGETGVGKELIAKLLHNNSSRARGPYIKVNCAAIPEQLLESELFGYSPGAFTGASKQGKPGQFELAQNGTIFLDEIAELPMMLQAKLLRVLQEQEINKVGGTTPVKVNARVITATNKDLEGLVKKQKFRDDLFYRLNVVPMTIPPLRRRKEDIPSLVFILLQQYNLQFGTSKKFTSGVLECFMNYCWPGNVRELANIVERLVVTSESPLITETDLPEFMRKIKMSCISLEEIDQYGSMFTNDDMALRDAVSELEEKMIRNAIVRHGSIRKAAKVLQVDPSTLVRKIDRFNKGTPH